MKYEGDLIITKENAKKYRDLKEVTGSLSVEAEASFPVLTSVGRFLSVRAEASFPVLTSVGRFLYVRAEASFPVLTSVGGYLSVEAEASFPVLTSVGRFLEIRHKGTLSSIPLTLKINGHELAVGDTALENIRRVATEALKDNVSLDMDTWHRCDTTHCIAGWAEHLFGEIPGCNTAAAGAIDLGLDAARHFFDNNKDDRDWLKQFVVETEK